MGLAFIDYKIKDKELENELNEKCKNIIQHIKQSYKPSFDGLLSRFKKVFKITPVTLKENKTQKAKELHELALYMLVTHTDDMELIAKEMNTDIKELEAIKQDDSLELKYEKQLNSFYKTMEDEYIINLHSNYSLRDILLDAIDKRM